MPHLTVEYSKSLSDKIPMDQILKKLHLSLEACSGLDLNRVKSRLVEHAVVLGGKGALEIQMVHVTLAILSGRDPETKKSYSQTLFDTVVSSVPVGVLSSISLTIEIRDMDRDSYIRN